MASNIKLLRDTATSYFDATLTYPYTNINDVFDLPDNCIGYLNFCQSAKVTEELNGEFKLEIEYLITDEDPMPSIELFNGIGKIIYCKANRSSNYSMQPFRITDIEYGSDSIAKITALHIRDDLRYYPIPSQADRKAIAWTPSSSDPQKYFIYNPSLGRENTTGYVDGYGTNETWFLNKNHTNEDSYIYKFNHCDIPQYYGKSNSSYFGTIPFKLISNYTTESKPQNFLFDKHIPAYELFVSDDANKREYPNDADYIFVNGTYRFSDSEKSDSYNRNTIINVFGGEILWNGLLINHVARRGSENANYTIKLGTGINNITIKKNDENYFTHLYVYYNDGSRYRPKLQSGEVNYADRNTMQYVSPYNHTNKTDGIFYPVETTNFDGREKMRNRVKFINLADNNMKIETQQTIVKIGESEETIDIMAKYPNINNLNAFAKKYIDNNFSEESISIDCDLIDLSGYDSFIINNNYEIGDSIKVEYSPLNLSFNARITSLEYDVLTDTYTKIGLDEKIKDLSFEKK